MPNPFLCIYIEYVISKDISLITFLNEPKLIFWHINKWFHLFLFNKQMSIHSKQFYFKQFSLACQQNWTVPSFDMYRGQIN